MKQILRIATVSACAILSSAVAAQSANVDVAIALSVEEGCVITNDPFRIDFGTYQRLPSLTPLFLLSTSSQSGSPLIIQCNADLANATIEFDGGLNPASGLRRLVNDLVPEGSEGKYMTYELFEGLDRSGQFQISVPRPISGSLFSGDPDVPGNRLLGSELLVSARIGGNDVVKGIANPDGSAGQYRDSVGLKITM